MMEQLSLDFSAPPEEYSGVADKCKSCHWLYKGRCIVKDTADGRCSPDTYMEERGTGGGTG